MNDELKTYLQGIEERLSTQITTEVTDVGASVKALAPHLDERLPRAA